MQNLLVSAIKCKMSSVDLYDQKIMLVGDMVISKLYH